MSKSNNKLIVILGPTASGKTGLSLRLAEKYNGEIVSADSRQIYRDMNIGTAKIQGTLVHKDGETRWRYKNVTHYMMDICNPNEVFTLVDYQKQAFAHIKDIQRREKIPFLVGGTGLYISSVIDNYIIPKGTPNKTMRDIYAQKTEEELYKELLMVSPELAQKVDKHNRRRLIRALEVSLGKGSDVPTMEKKGKPIFDVLQIGVDVSREALYERIHERIDEMVDQGLVDEVKNLLKSYDASLPSMSGIGYRQIVQYLKGEMDLHEAIQMVKRDTRRYARRQMTWFRRDKRIHWVSDLDAVDTVIDDFLAQK